MVRACPCCHRARSSPLHRRDRVEDAATNDHNGDQGAWLKKWPTLMSAIPLGETLVADAKL